MANKNTTITYPAGKYWAGDPSLALDGAMWRPMADDLNQVYSNLKPISSSDSKSWFNFKHLGNDLIEVTNDDRSIVMSVNKVMVDAVYHHTIQDTLIYVDSMYEALIPEHLVSRNEDCGAYFERDNEWQSTLNSSQELTI